MSESIRVWVNDQSVDLKASGEERLLDLLRGDLALYGTKEGCGEGECGACTVLLDGLPVLSCLVPVGQCAERQVRTVEWVAERSRGLIERLTEAGGIQCGACTPGIVVSLFALSKRSPQPTRQEIQECLAGNLCRCTGYEGIFRAFDGKEVGV